MVEILISENLGPSQGHNSAAAAQCSNMGF